MNQPIRQVGGALLSAIVGVSSLAVLASPAQAAPPARITGTITVAGGGVLAGVKVTALSLADTGEWAEVDTAMSGADGKYQIGKFDTGTYRIRFDDPSGAYQTEFYDDQPRIDLAQDISLVKGGGKIEHIDAELGAAAHLTGRVTGSSQEGLADAVVTAYVRQGADWVEFQHVDTAANGTYDLGGLPGGVYTLGFVDTGSGVSEFWNDKALLADADPISVSNSGTTSGLDAELATPVPTPDPVPAPDPVPTTRPDHAVGHARARRRTCARRDGGGRRPGRGRSRLRRDDAQDQWCPEGRPAPARHLGSLEPDGCLPHDPVARQRQEDQARDQGPPAPHQPTGRQEDHRAGDRFGARHDGPDREDREQEGQALNR